MSRCRCSAVVFSSRPSSFGCGGVGFSCVGGVAHFFPSSVPSSAEDLRHSFSFFKLDVSVKQQA
jgi:hypothetical protein